MVYRKKTQQRERREHQRVRRELRRERESERKRNSTFKLNRGKSNVTKWGEPFYVREKLLTPWKLHRRKESIKNGFWLNPITHEIIEYYLHDFPPPDHISYPLRSTVPKAKLTPVCHSLFITEE
jgi:hypothetical protein